MAVDQYAASEIDPVFKSVVTSWLSKLEHAKKHKKRVFQEAADECLQFYAGPKDWDELMGHGLGVQQSEGFPSPGFKVSVNKTFEFVTIFGPALYYENPVRTAKPRAPIVIPPAFFADMNVYNAVIQQENSRVQDDGLRGVLIESMLNWTPNNFNLSGESRLAIDEGLIKGRGCCWTELYQPPGANFRVVRSTWDSTDMLLVDPDARSFADARWIARMCIHPAWKVEKDFGLRPGSLRGHCESNSKQAEVDTSDDTQYDRKRGLTNDLIKYYKVYSKMGIGGRLQGFPEKTRPAMEMFGDNCYVVVAEGVPFPLNLPPDVMDDPAFAADPTKVFARTGWPTPFWANGGWPVSVLDFHPVHNSPWPMPHLKAGMGELKFLNWVMSFLMGKIRTTSRDFIAFKKSLNEELKSAIVNGEDLTCLELEAEHGTINEVIQFLQHPAMNGDIWKVIEAVEANFDKRVGLTELMYGDGGATQIRSAAEASVRNQNMNVRPEDMGTQVEAWQSQIAANEAICARWHLKGTDVSPIIGPLGASAWDTYVVTDNLQAAAYQLEYRIESGSTRRPNKGQQVQQQTMAFQGLAPILQAYATQTGDNVPLSNLIGDYVETLELDPAKYQLQSVPPPAPEPAPGEDGQDGGNPPA